MIELEKVDGPPCPRCGCPASEVVREAECRGTLHDKATGRRVPVVRRSETRVCDSCACRWTAQTQRKDEGKADERRPDQHEGRRSRRGH